MIHKNICMQTNTRIRISNRWVTLSTPVFMQVYTAPKYCKNLTNSGCYLVFPCCCLVVATTGTADCCKSFQPRVTLVGNVICFSRAPMLDHVCVSDGAWSGDSSLCSAVQLCFLLFCASLDLLHHKGVMGKRRISGGHCEPSSFSDSGHEIELKKAWAN